MDQDDELTHLDRKGQARMVDVGAKEKTQREARAARVVQAAEGNAWKYHLRPGPLRFAAHRALWLGSCLAPGVMMRQFDWIYGHDVTRPPAGGR